MDVKMKKKRMIGGFLPLVVIMVVVLISGHCSAFPVITCTDHCFKECKRGGGFVYYCAFRCFNCCLNHKVCHCPANTSRFDACAQNCLNLDEGTKMGFCLKSCTEDSPDCDWKFYGA